MRASPDCGLRTGPTMMGQIGLAKHRLLGACLHVRATARVEGLSAIGRTSA